MKKVFKLFSLVFVAATLFLVSCAGLVDNSAPAPVTDVSVSSEAGKIILSWKDPADSDLYGIKIYNSEIENLVKGVIVEKGVQRYEVRGLEDGKSYIFELTALDRNLNESARVKSKKVTYIGNGLITEIIVKKYICPNDNIEYDTAEEAAECCGVEYVEVEKPIYKYVCPKDKKEFDTAEKAAECCGVQIEEVEKLVDKIIKVYVCPEDGQEYDTPEEAADCCVDRDNPVLLGDRAYTLNTLFNINEIGTTTIKIKRSEWDTLCTNFDEFYENEECVHCDYVFTKGGNTWKMKDCGFRLRGNTTRVRPQGPDHWRAERRNNWEDGTLAQSDGYRQAHFKVNFEKFKDKNVDYKMAGFAKGVNLKRFNSDSMYGREMSCYDLFRHNGIIAPRASYTRLFVEITEEDNTVKSLDYGVYEMFEDLGKQFVKSYENLWGDFDSKKCFLFKCGGGSNLMPTDYDSVIGEDNITMEAATTKKYTYSIKEGKVDKAKARMTKFIEELNALDVNDTAAVKAWYEASMDMDYYLKTLAISVLTGMDDDYWGNANNWYAYFDINDKFWWIPYDYDNTIGHSIKRPSAYERNVFQWCENQDVGKRPLVEKMLTVPEFKAKYAEYLKYYSNDSYTLNFKSRVQGWQSKISAFTESSDIVYDCDVSKTINTNADMDHYEKMRANVATWIVDRKITFDLNGGNINGDTQSIVKEGNIGSFKTEIAMPEKDDFLFAGWTLTKDGNDFVTSLDSSMTDVTVYAKWDNEVLLLETPNGNSVSLAEIEAYGDDVTVKIEFICNKGKTSEGKWAGIGFYWGGDIVGWWKGPDEVDNFTEVYKYRIADLITMYEQFADDRKSRDLLFNCFDDPSNCYTAKLYVTKEIPDVIINFDLNGGTSPASYAIYKDTNTKYALPYATRAGYNFVGWYEDSALTKPSYLPKTFDDVVFPPSPSEVTLYAGWIPQETYNKVYKLEEDISRKLKISLAELLTKLPVAGDSYQITIRGRQLLEYKEFNAGTWKGIASGAAADNYWQEIAEFGDIEVTQDPNTFDFEISFKANITESYNATVLGDLRFEMDLGNYDFITKAIYLPATVTMEKIN